MTRLLVTGAAGFIGANLVRRMLREGHEVHVTTVDRQAEWRLSQIANHLQWHTVDLRDAPAVATVVRQVKPRWVFHLAAHGAYSWQDDMRQILETNFLGTVNLVEACAAVGVERFINTGSSSEYGFKDQPPSEDAWLEPNSYYAVAKASATLFCRYVAQSRKFPAVTLRLYSIYGPYEEPKRLMPSLAVYGLAGGYPPLVDPRVARDYVYVDDVVDAYCLAAARDHEPGAVYNLGTGRQTTLAEVVELAQGFRSVRRAPLGFDAQPRLGHHDVAGRLSEDRKVANLAAAEPIGNRLSPACGMAPGGSRAADVLSTKPVDLSEAGT